MSGSRSAGRRSPQSISAEIETELRSVLHKLDELRSPIREFRELSDRPTCTPRYFVPLSAGPPRKFTGLRINVHELKLPVEWIVDKAAFLAAAVWHLKDRLHHYAKAAATAADCEAWANADPNLRICGDLGNHKKHGNNQNLSGLRPRLVPEVVFDTSGSGMIEFHYDGAIKQGDLVVSNLVPIPYRVDVVDNAETVIGSAASIIQAGFSRWLPLIQQIGLLDGTDRDKVALRVALFSGNETMVSHLEGRN